MTSCGVSNVFLCYGEVRTRRLQGEHKSLYSENKLVLKKGSFRSTETTPDMNLLDSYKYQMNIYAIKA